MLVLKTKRWLQLCLRYKQWRASSIFPTKIRTYAGFLSLTFIYFTLPVFGDWEDSRDSKVNTSHTGNSKTHGFRSLRSHRQCCDLKQEKPCGVLYGKIVTQPVTMLIQNALSVLWMNRWLIWYYTVLQNKIIRWFRMWRLRKGQRSQREKVSI